MTKQLLKETCKKIREEIKNGNSKYQIAVEYGLHPHTVYRRTLDFSGSQFGWPGIRGNTFKLLQDIMQHG